MQATRSFDMWTVSQWPRATCQEIVILDNTAMEISKLKCVTFLIFYNSIGCTFHLSSHLLNISCWSPYSNNVTNLIFLAKYFTVISKHRTYREFSSVSNKTFFLPWLRFFHASSSVVGQMPGVKLAKTGHGPHSSTLVVICVVRLLFVLFYVLFVCKCVLPPGDNATAVNKYTISYQILQNIGWKYLLNWWTE